MDVLKKHKSEKILLPCTDILRDVIPNTLTENNIKFTKTVLYRTVAADLSDLENVFYDILVFFSPGGIESLLKNFPDFKQNNTLIAAFGATTATAAIKNGLEPNIRAPHPKAPSMVGAIELFIKYVGSLKNTELCLKLTLIIFYFRYSTKCLAGTFVALIQV